MNCMKCGGRVFLDRVFSDNKNFEVYCLLCGKRSFIGKNTGLGKWLESSEQERMNAAIIAR